MVTGSLSSSELAAAQQLETFHLFLRNVGIKACQTEEDDAEFLVLSTSTFYLCSELDVGRPCHLATLCVPEDSIVVTTTFLRTYLMCIDCCLSKAKGCTSAVPADKALIFGNPQ